MRFAAISTFSANQIGCSFAGRRSSGTTTSLRSRPRTSKVTGATFKIMRLEKPRHLKFTMWVVLDKLVEDVDSEPAEWRGKRFLDSAFIVTNCYHDEDYGILSSAVVMPNNSRVCLRFSPHLKKICFIQIFRINFHTSPHNSKLSTKIRPKNSTRTSSKRSCQSRTTTRPCHRAGHGTSPTANATRKPRASTRRLASGSRN